VLYNVSPVKGVMYLIYTYNYVTLNFV
jgi:hypothetical protein